jgi:hypothetical protein
MFASGTLRITIALLTFPFALLFVSQANEQRRRQALLVGREPKEIHALVQEMLQVRWMPPQAAREAWVEVAQQLDVEPSLMRAGDELHELLRADPAEHFKVHAMLVRRHRGTVPARLTTVTDAVELMIAFNNAREQDRAEIEQSLRR